jgi:hypothetical protein
MKSYKKNLKSKSRSKKHLTKKHMVGGRKAQKKSNKSIIKRLQSPHNTNNPNHLLPNQPPLPPPIVSRFDFRTMEQIRYNSNGNSSNNSSRNSSSRNSSNGDRQ